MRKLLALFIFFVMTSIKHFLLLLLSFSAISFAVPVSYGMATSDTVKVVDLGVENPHSAIVVSRGCRSEYIKQDSLIDKNLPQDSLLSLVYGNVPSPDSADIYRGWGDNCQKYASDRLYDGWQTVAMGVFFAALGLTLTFVVDYDYLGTAILGRTFGIGTLLTVVPFTFGLGVSDISGSSEQREMGKRYMEKAERYKDRYKISIAPAINLQEPGGGLFLQLGF
ncbi:hypothetical protein [Fibrobacter sp. UWR2]|uniref:hypothetical protein n=1 Tax=Fibrobacter sp. UWR2 TaxID=1964352 RepID=UPI000B5229C6|nr:hypothetical protein [Fibrobacter sp. UWR2]OWU99546.1 hypothetical protein B7994_11220 [Fibrobacter sp. UWR2]